MPEDLLIGFDFKIDHTPLNVLDDAATRDAADRLASDIAYFNAVAEHDSASSSEDTVALRGAPTDAFVWADDVPPDLSDGNGFLL